MDKTFCANGGDIDPVVLGMAQRVQDFFRLVESVIYYSENCYVICGYITVENCYVIYV